MEVVWKDYSKGCIIYEVYLKFGDIAYSVTMTIIFILFFSLKKFLDIRIIPNINSKRNLKHLLICLEVYL